MSKFSKIGIEYYKKGTYCTCIFITANDMFLNLKTIIFSQMHLFPIHVVVHTLYCTYGNVLAQLRI